MATAYAAFTSLMTLITQLHEHPYPPIKLDEKHFESLLSKISFFQTFLEDHHSTVEHELEIRLADASHDAEDLIETHIADRVLDQKDFEGRLQRMIQGFDLIKSDVSNEQSQPRHRPMPLRSSQPPSETASGKNVVVGLEDPTTKIVDKLTLQHKKSGHQVISITGMGGIGKTTLARKVYNHPYVKNYFDIRAWATISKDYDIQKSLVELIHCLIDSKESLSEMKEHELGEKLYKTLFGRRYLIILDDLWGVEAWERLRSFFPASSGSGIVITTRESTVASISSLSFRMDLLDERKSWDLFCEKVFGKHSCPPELEDLGKNIANKCRGLPLSIVVIGGHLRKSPKTEEYWKKIENNLSSVVNLEDNEHCLQVLSLSYSNLPVHLKPCFLYMGVFPEDEEIKVSQLTRLWIAEGFLKPIHNKSMEEVARDYFNDLVGRNLILPSHTSFSGKIRRCKIHDLLWDLCLKEALKNNFLCIRQWNDVLEVSSDKRRIIVCPGKYDLNHYCSDTLVKKSSSVLRTSILHDIPPLVVYKLLRVLVAVRGSTLIPLHTMLEAALQLVNMRCLDFSQHISFYEFPIQSSIFSLWNLQYLVVYNFYNAEAPPEIWKMPQLRQISIPNLHLSDPPVEGSNDTILKNLQAVQTVINFNVSEDLAKRVPNIKKLKVLYEEVMESDERAYNVSYGRFEKLESFKCSFWQMRPTTENGMVSNLTLPHSLKKLEIGFLTWDDVTTKIGLLPLLEVLRLYECAVREWNLVEGQFVSLKYLMLSDCRQLQCFTADVNHFPCLQTLDLRAIPLLEEISSDIGDMPTLRSIKLYDCADEAVVSAKEISEYQYQMANEELQIEAYLRRNSKLSAESLSTSNFHVYPCSDP